uniref:Electron transfer flavoprotein subunit beta n=1 Tax=Geospiza parvula TaxID=87175 RepID=A0A8U8BZJ0_GEOPR
VADLAPMSVWAVRVAPGGGVHTQGVKHSLNPFCEIALEEAVRLREAGIVGYIHPNIARDCGIYSPQCRGALWDIFTPISRGIVGYIPPKACENGRGARPIPGFSQFIPAGSQPILGRFPRSELVRTGLPQGTFASRVQLEAGAVLVEREVDGGLETLRLRLPAVLTADLRLNEPRYATLPNIMKAKKKPLEVLPAAELGVAAGPPRLKVLQVREPPPRAGGERVESVESLLGKLRHAGRI